ncbi:protein kinase-like protein [Kribbella sp. VKM Ac-2571]|uniref:protein kinase domain-containing protein n=1 Tax=Kribbella sp. VKM Ac-2571 TaxID=2512222 RepID=UPI00105F0DE0|nr:protein kinase-like protein [Kribbella sp. VKM Ac-2571]
MWEHWNQVAEESRAVKGDYRLDARALGEGGQAIVTAGVHKSTGLEIAFKRLRPGLMGDRESRARMRREIDYGRTLLHENVTPVLDADTKCSWLVMPLARADLKDQRGKIADNQARLALLVGDVCAGLRAAHERGWVHRDIKPSNILRFSLGGKGRWVVADWGLGRGPTGKTTLPGRTRAGVLYGSVGFAAPELSVDAHAASASADIYSLGQLIGWLVSGRFPLANVPNLPPDGPWRSVVAAATEAAAVDRPQSIRDFLDLVYARVGVQLSR